MSVLTYDSPSLRRPSWSLAWRWSYRNFAPRSMAAFTCSAVSPTPSRPFGLCDWRAVTRGGGFCSAPGGAGGDDVAVATTGAVVDSFDKPIPNPLGAEPTGADVAGAADPTDAEAAGTVDATADGLAAGCSVGATSGGAYSANSFCIAASGGRSGVTMTCVTSTLPPPSVARAIDFPCSSAAMIGSAPASTGSWLGRTPPTQMAVRSSANF